jgi:signal transduction histidine kinase
MYLRRFSTLSTASVVCLVYCIVGKLSLKLAFVHASASPVWPPAGIALAALLVLGNRVWPGIFVGAFVVNATTAGNLVTSFCIASGNMLEAICGAWLVNRFANGTRVFERSQDVFKFTVAAIFSTLISPIFGVTSLALTGFADWTRYSAIWLTWWLGDMTGDLVVAPLIILWSVAPRRRLNPAKDIEVGSLLLLLIVVAEAVFGGWLPITARNYPISFVCGPLLIWAAFRFTPRETATAIFIFSIIAMWGTLHAFGPFVMETENQSLLITQTSTAVLAITALALAAAMAERRRAEAAINEQKTAVETANRTKDNFLAMLSHELRTPLTPVLAALDALETFPSHSEEARSSLAMIRRNVELESQLIDDLLDLTRIARDKLQLNLEEIDTHQAITNVVEICKVEASAKNIRIHLNLRAGAHHVTADTAKLQQIIWNLLKNAIKFTPEGGEISISSANPSPQKLAISVRDTGIGMAPEIMIRIFNPFEQGDQSLQRRFGGLGLGLTISKSLAEAHGGTLFARSEGVDRGSTFVLTLNTVAPRQRQLVEQETQSVERQALRILLVDDHEDTCTALERLLVRRGHLVAAAHNMRSAMEAAARNDFDLLISDIALPDGTGTELIACIRAIRPVRGIAISGFGMNGDIEKSIKAGFSDHLVKPIKLERLEAAIERVMAS